MRIPWPWRRRTPSPETVELQKKLEEVKRDDAAIGELSARARNIMNKNHLAADIAKALGIR